MHGADFRKSVRRMVACAGALSLLGVTPAWAQSEAQAPAAAAERGEALRQREAEALEKAVVRAITERRGVPRHGAYVDVKRVDGTGAWAFGSVALLTPRVENARDGEPEQLPEGLLWVARHDGREWKASVETLGDFGDQVHASPDELISAGEKHALAPRLMPAGDNTANLTAPWAPGQSWSFRGGPHGWGGSERPFSSIDLNGGDGRVLAANDGYFYKMCGTGYVQVRGTNGWTTDYYHLTNRAGYADGTFIGRETYLGNVGTNIDCGGAASGPHVHFALRQNGAFTAWNGRELGGWTIYEGTSAYQGSAERSGQWVGVNGTLYKFGVQYQAHVQNIGWQGAQSNGATAGTAGQNLRMEGLNISLQRPPGTPSSLDICYEAHVENIGWQGVRCNAQTAGTTGQNLRIEALRVWLTNPVNRAGVCYRGYVEGLGWQSWVCNGAIAGTTGQGRRLEGIQIRITP